MNAFDWMLFAVVVILALAGSYVTNENRMLKAHIMRLRYGNTAQDAER